MMIKEDKPGAQPPEEVDKWEAVLAFAPEGYHNDDVECDY